MTSPSARATKSCSTNAAVAALAERWVQINGCIRKPGRYEWKSNMTLTDLLREAGGFTEGAMYLEAEVARVAASGLPGDSLAEIIRVPIVAGNMRRTDPDLAIPAILTDATEGSRFVLQPQRSGRNPHESRIRKAGHRADHGAGRLSRRVHYRTTERNPARPDPALRWPDESGLCARRPVLPQRPAAVPRLRRAARPPRQPRKHDAAVRRQHLHSARSPIPCWSPAK